jgi:acetyl-CoA acyltransferase
MRNAGREVVVVDAVRTPVGKGHPEKGYYKNHHANELLGACYRALFERVAIHPTELDDVVAGCVFQYGEQTYNVARNAWLQEGLPVEVPATTVDRQCGSAQQAINFAAALIGSGAQDAVIACGVEHMGHVPMGVGLSWEDQVGTPWPPALMEKHDLVSQGISAELIAERWELTRAELDELAVRSHRRAARATEEGRFEREMVPMEVNGEVVAVDQGIRPETDLEALAGLRPAFKEEGRITAGTSSQISDGAAAVLLTSREKADALGLEPRLRIVDQVAVGVDPVIMLTGPIPATEQILRRNGLKLDDIDLFEVNEAFASVVGAWEREFDPDPEKVNVNGGAMAIGHPMGSTGARLLATMVNELERTDGSIGLVTMCCGGGVGTGTLVERV